MTKTRKVILIYGVWSLLLLCIALYGAIFTTHGEFGVSTHLWLTITGLPLSLLSWLIKPNGTVLGTLVAGVIGLLQWSAVAEVSTRWDEWRKSKRKSN